MSTAEERQQQCAADEHADCEAICSGCQQAITMTPLLDIIREDRNRVMRYVDQNNQQPYNEHCAAYWPATGHQCELLPGHKGHHDRIISGTWVRWCDVADRASCTDSSRSIDINPNAIFLSLLILISLLPCRVF